MTLSSTDVRAHPTVDFAHFEHPDDVADGLEAIRILKGVLDSKALASLKCDTVPEALLQLAPQLSAFSPGHYPGALPLLPDENSLSEATTWLKDTVCTCWHFHGSCRVGEVVDSEHRVKGVGALRIMDASVLRNTPGTNPMATIMAVGRVLGLRMRKERV